ncbi:6-bladed beta-propeller [Gemmatimonadota bacterium]
MRMSPCAILCLLLTLPTWSATAQEHTFRVYDRDGLTISETTGGPRYTSELFSYEPILVITGDESGEGMLYNPSEFLMDEQGNFYIYDSGATCMTVFDREGRFSHSFGGSGAGPGEFMFLRLQSVRDGIVSVYDWNQLRTSRFSYDGALVSVTRVPPEPIDTVLSFHITPDNQQLVLIRDYQRSGNDAGLEWNGMMVFDGTQKKLFEYDFTRVKTRYPGVLKSQGREQSELFFYQYSAQPKVLYRQDIGIISSTGVEPVLEIFDPDGTRTREIRIDLEYKPLSRQEKRQVKGFLKEYSERVTWYFKDLFLSELECLEWPSHKAFWSDFQVDDDGYFWLCHPTQRMYEINREFSGHRFRILSPEGEYLGDTSWPKGIYGRVSNGHLCMSYHDRDTGEFALTVYKINPIVEGLEYPD